MKARTSNSEEYFKQLFWRKTLTDFKPELSKADFSEPLWDTEQAAKYLNYSPGTLAVWRCTKRYDLKPIRIGRQIRYNPSLIRQFASQHFTQP